MIKSVITTEQTKKMFTSDFATRDNQFKLTSIAIKKPAQFVCSKGMTQALYFDCQSFKIFKWVLFRFRPAFLEDPFFCGYSDDIRFGFALVSR